LIPQWLKMWNWNKWTKIVISDKPQGLKLKFTLSLTKIRNTIFFLFIFLSLMKFKNTSFFYFISLMKLENNSKIPTFFYLLFFPSLPEHNFFILFLLIKLRTQINFCSIIFFCTPKTSVGFSEITDLDYTKLNQNQDQGTSHY